MGFSHEYICGTHYSSGYSCYWSNPSSSCFKAPPILAPQVVQLEPQVHLLKTQWCLVYEGCPALLSCRFLMMLVDILHERIASQRWRFINSWVVLKFYEVCSLNYVDFISFCYILVTLFWVCGCDECRCRYMCRFRCMCMCICMCMCMCMCMVIVSTIKSVLILW